MQMIFMRKARLDSLEFPRAFILVGNLFIPLYSLPIRLSQVKVLSYIIDNQQAYMLVKATA